MRVFQDTPTVMLSTSPGRNGGANVLRTAVASAPFFGNEVLASLAIPNFTTTFDLASGSLVDPDLDEQFRAAISTLTTEPLEAAHLHSALEGGTVLTVSTGAINNTGT